DMISMRAMKPLCSGINVSTNAGSNARTSPDFPDQQKQLTGRPLPKLRLERRDRGTVVSLAKDRIELTFLTDENFDDLAHFLNSFLALIGPFKEFIGRLSKKPLAPSSPI
ncbi:hypothetical protein HJB67_27990, partial [Rhizobium lentis]|uniref:hypothetical protein n=1 Tax=Rhizobium lentis TaxID=1138194 RepID=UPI001C8340BE